MAALLLCHSCIHWVSRERREEMWHQFLWLLESPSSLLAHALPTLCSANSVNSKTAGVKNKINETIGVVGRIPSR